jgi:hypothetical protein
MLAVLQLSGGAEGNDIPNLFCGGRDTKSTGLRLQEVKLKPTHKGGEERKY